MLLLLLNANSLRQQPPTRWGHSKPTVALNLQPELVAAAVVAVGGGAFLWQSGSEQRARRARYAEYEAKSEADRQERARLAYIAPRETWTETELAEFNGMDETGPLLFAADGLVFNVWKGRHFYGPGCQYHVFAGRDATRLLAKTKLEEETPEELMIPLSIGERAALAGWIWTFKSKYEIVGKLDGFNSKDTSM
jgi:membrane-associated progesterone receptor component